MALRLHRALAVAALSLSCFASAYNNYSSVNVARSQVTLMDDRPKDCPPWYGSYLPREASRDNANGYVSQLQLQPPDLFLRPVCAL